MNKRIDDSEMYCSKHFSRLAPRSLKFTEIIIDINKDLQIRFLPHRKLTERPFEGLIVVYYGNDTKSINTMCGLNKGYLMSGHVV
jgi:hypothetical protein